MPDKHVFSKAERWAVWSAHEGHCFWCGEPFDYQFCTIDHVIPEFLLNDDDKLALAIASYGLGADFKINDFCNWVPSHQRCNGVKATAVFDPSPAFLLILKRLKREEERARAIHRRSLAHRSCESIIAALEIGIEEKVVPIERVLELLEATRTPPSGEVRLERIEASVGESKDSVLFIGGWKIQERNGDIVYATRDGRHGYSYIGNENPEGFRCPHCGLLGPWNGTRCLSCGMMSDPTD